MSMNVILLLLIKLVNALMYAKVIKMQRILTRLAILNVKQKEKIKRDRAIKVVIFENQLNAKPLVKEIGKDAPQLVLKNNF